MKCIKISGGGKVRYLPQKNPIVKKGWAKIKVISSGLCGSDITRIVSDKKSRLSITDKIWGHEFSGMVSDIEKNSSFKKGE